MRSQLFLSALAVLAFPGAAFAQGFAAALTAQQFNVSPGDTVRGSIEVVSTSPDPVTIEISVGDFTPLQKSGNVYAFVEPGSVERSLLPWLEFSPKTIALSPGVAQTISFTLSVPADSSLSGSFWGAIYATSADTAVQDLNPSEEGVGAAGPKIGLRYVYRQAIKIYATVIGTAQRSAKIRALDLARPTEVEDGFNALATFQNLGNVHLQPKVWLEVHDTNGQLLHRSDHRELIVLPGSELDYTFQIRDIKLEPGEYLLLITADYGGTTLVAGQAVFHLKPRDNPSG